MAVTVNAAIIDEKDTVVVAIEKINAGWRCTEDYSSYRCTNVP